MLMDKVRHTRRFQEIINAFLRNGFSHFLFRLGLTERKTSRDTYDNQLDMNLQNIGVKLRMTLQQLGPAFIKLGQIASSRRDLIPEEIARELEKLQDHVEPFPFAQVQAIIEEELGQELDDLFVHFEEEPLAAASIGQVHLATLPSGEKAAVKIQRPDIQARVETDLSILFDIVKLVEANTSWAKTYRLREMLHNFSRSLHDELDYRVEKRNGARIAKQFDEQKEIHIPNVFEDYSTKRVLTMECIKGIKINQVDVLDSEGYDRQLIAERLVNSMMQQILEHGFFHGDPHPGNLYVQPGQVIAYIDFGMVGRLNEELKQHLASILLQLRTGDSSGLIKTFDAMGIMHENTDRAALLGDLDDLKVRYYDVALQEISVGEVFIELFTVAYRHRVRIPSELPLLGKALLSLEQIVSTLDPSFNIMKAVEPFGRKLIRQRYSPSHLMHATWKQLRDNLEILLHLPKDLKEATATLQKGKLQLDINVQQIQIILRRFDRISNRLSFSIVLLAFSILMVGLIIGSAIARQENMLLNLPVIEIGSLVAALMFVYLFISIFRSGRM